MLEFGGPSRSRALHGLHAKSESHITSKITPLQDPHIKDSDSATSIKVGRALAGHAPELQSSAKPMATRSLSATVRKKSLSGDATSTQQVRDVLEAVLAENEIVGGASKADIGTVGGTSCVDTASILNGATDKRYKDVINDAGKRNGFPHHDSDVQHKGTSNEAKLSEITDSTLLSNERATIVPDADKKPKSFPIKPVLLNYKIPKPSTSPTKPSSTSKTVLNPAPAAHPPSARPDEGGEEEGEGGTEDVDVASRSLTQHTLRVITEKVRNMNSK